MTRARAWLGVALAIGALATDAGARADALPGRPTCPAQPRDGTSCRAFHAGAACRYPRRGVICECRRVSVDEHRRLLWSCGELGE